MARDHSRQKADTSSIPLEKRLKGARVMRGVQQQDMAERLGLSDARVVRFIEAGKIDPDRYAAKYARALEMPVGWFYGEVAV